VYVCVRASAHQWGILKFDQQMVELKLLDFLHSRVDSRVSKCFMLGNV
jgi:hypothetical protein